MSPPQQIPPLESTITHLETIGKKIFKNAFAEGERKEIADYLVYDVRDHLEGHLKSSSSRNVWAQSEREFGLQSQANILQREVQALKNELGAVKLSRQVDIGNLAIRDGDDRQRETTAGFFGRDASRGSSFPFTFNVVRNPASFPQLSSSQSRFESESKPSKLFSFGAWESVMPSTASIDINPNKHAGNSAGNSALGTKFTKTAASELRAYLESIIQRKESPEQPSESTLTTIEATHQDPKTIPTATQESDTQQHIQPSSVIEPESEHKPKSELEITQDPASPPRDLDASVTHQSLPTELGTTPRPELPPPETKNTEKEVPESAALPMYQGNEDPERSPKSTSMIISEATLQDSNPISTAGQDSRIEPLVQAPTVLGTEPTQEPKEKAAIIQDPFLHPQSLATGFGTQSPPMVNPFLPPQNQAMGLGFQVPPKPLIAFGSPMFGRSNTGNQIPRAPATHAPTIELKLTGAMNQTCKGGSSKMTKSKKKALETFSGAPAAAPETVRIEVPFERRTKFGADSKSSGWSSVAKKKP